ncbi:MAG: hypothetical protein AAGF25_06895 [Pseudomonadota bacterium]
MLNSLDTEMLVVLFMIVAIGSFFIGSMMNGVLEEDGFGTIGNMGVLIAGAFFGFYAIDALLYGTSSVQIAVAGVTGGFMTLAFTVITKALLNRFGY